MILTCLRKVKAKGNYETAKWLHAVIGAVFRYAIANGSTETDPTYALRDAIIRPTVTPRAAITEVKAQIVFDQRMQAGQRVIGHSWKHVVFDMVIQVPIDEAADEIHVNGARIQAMIGHVISQAAMLQKPGHHMVPRAKKPGQPDDHERQDRVHPEGEADSGCIVCGRNSGDADDR